MAYAAARLVVSFQTFDSDMSTNKDAVVLPSVMKAPNLRSARRRRPRSLPGLQEQPPSLRRVHKIWPPDFRRLGHRAKTWCRWHRKVPASLRGDDIVHGNKKAPTCTIVIQSPFIRWTLERHPTAADGIHAFYYVPTDQAQKWTSEISLVVGQMLSFALVPT